MSIVPFTVVLFCLAMQLSCCQSGLCYRWWNKLLIFPLDIFQHQWLPPPFLYYIDVTDMTTHFCTNFIPLAQHQPPLHFLQQTGHLWLRILLTVEQLAVLCLGLLGIDLFLFFIKVCLKELFTDYNLKRYVHLWKQWLRISCCRLADLKSQSALSQEFFFFKISRNKLLKQMMWSQDC